MNGYSHQCDKTDNEMLSVLRQVNERDHETGAKLKKGTAALLNNLLQQMQESD
jgi:hypothetical protein